MVLALLMAFIFLCVAGFEWLSLHFGSIFAGLIVAGVFIVVAIIGAVVSAALRRRIRERAILERAARAHTPSWFLDPKILSVAVQAGRSLGWRRIVPVALFGFMATQWAREYRDRSQQP